MEAIEHIILYEKLNIDKIIENNSELLDNIIAKRILR